MSKTKIKPEYTKNGVRIDVHSVKNNQVYFQRWERGIKQQGMFDNLFRMQKDEFIKQVKEAK